MTNFEFHKEKLLQMDKEDNPTGAVKNGQLKFCSEVDCLECEFYNGDGDSCYFNFWKWLASEHVDKPKLTKYEKGFLTLLDPDCYIARVNTNDIFIYNAKPIKQDGCWVSFKNEVIASVFLNANQFILFRDTFFPFIRSEDAEPWKISDLLELEVEDDLQT